VAQADTVAVTNHVRVSRTKLLVGIAVVAAFLAGLIPMWLLARTRSAQVDTDAQRIGVLQLDNGIAAAGLYAKRGEYEAARKYASDFFTQLRSTVDNGDTLSQGERDAMRPLLSQRDDVITLLARSDPAAVDRLFGIEYQLRQDLKSRL
jgi:hypothetical protein